MRGPAAAAAATADPDLEVAADFDAVLPVAAVAAAPEVPAVPPEVDPAADPPPELGPAEDVVLPVPPIPPPPTPSTTGEPGSGIVPSTYGFLQFCAVGGGGAWPPFIRAMALKSAWTSTGGRGE